MNIWIPHWVLPLLGAIGVLLSIVMTIDHPDGGGPEGFAVKLIVILPLGAAFVVCVRAGLGM